MFLKIIAAVIGYKMAKLPGLVLGLVLGHLLDEKLKSEQGEGNLVELVKDKSLTEEDRIFFVATFSLFAKLAKSDGRINQEEIRAVEHIIENILELNTKIRRKVIAIFKAAEDDNTSFHHHAVVFQEAYGRNQAILRAMLESMFSIALADGTLNEVEERLIRSAADIFGFSEESYLSIKSRYVRVDTSRPKATESLASEPYKILECSPNDSNEVIKKKYRSLVQEYHPDKLAAKDLPKGFEKFASDKFREIQDAFTQIKAERGID